MLSMWMRIVGCVLLEFGLIVGLDRHDGSRTHYYAAGLITIAVALFVAALARG